MRVPKFSEYILTPFDIARGICAAYQQATLRDFIGILAVASIGIIMLIATPLSGTVLFFVIFIAVLLYWRLDARVPLTLGLACLVGIPILLLLFRTNILLTGEYRAEQIAVWAYYFLVIGVLRQVLPSRKKKFHRLHNHTDYLHTHEKQSRTPRRTTMHDIKPMRPTPKLPKKNHYENGL